MFEFLNENWEKYQKQKIRNKKGKLPTKRKPDFGEVQQQIDGRKEMKKINSLLLSGWEGSPFLIEEK